MMFRGAISRLIHLQVSCASIFGLRLPMSKRGLTTVRVNSPPIFASSFSSTCADVHLVPMFEDNYGFIIVDKHSGKSACIDPGDGVVMADALRKLQLNLTMVWCTHKHMDHIGGVADLKRVFPGATVYGTKYETVPKLEVPVGDKDKFQLGELLVEVIYTPCHTKGHVAFLVSPPEGSTSSHCTQESAPSTDTASPLLFCGDTLFVGGCGRFFEGTAAEMLLNMDKFAALPPHTQVFCAHEYTESNLRFLSAVEAGMVTAKLAHASAVVTTAASTFEVARSATIANSFNDTGAAVDLPSSVVHEEMKRRIQQGLPTVPTTIFKELQYNLFMKCREFRTQRLVGAFSAEEAMAKLRDMKNAFL